MRLNSAVMAARSSAARSASLAHLPPAAVVGQHGLKRLIGDAQDDGAEHLNQAAVGVVAEAGVAGQLDESGHHLVVQANIEHGIHHAGH